VSYNLLSPIAPFNKYLVKGEYDGTFEINSNTYILDFDKGSVEKKDIYYNQNSYNGHIWLNGNEISPKHAAKLRPSLASKETDFCWGNKGAGSKIVALAICAHIFKYREWAINMYQPFAEKYIYPLRRENFEIEIDLKDFLIDNREKLTFDYFTRYFDFSGGTREIALVRNDLTKKYSVNLLDEVAWAYVERKEFFYNWKVPSLPSVFGMKEKEPEIEKPCFDKHAVFKTIRRSLQRQFFTKQYARLEDSSSYMLESKIQKTLYLFSSKQQEYLNVRAEKRRKAYIKDRSKFLQKIIRDELKENKYDENIENNAEQ